MEMLTIKIGDYYINPATITFIQFDYNDAGVADRASIAFVGDGPDDEYTLTFFNENAAAFKHYLDRSATPIMDFR